jgi:GTP cyclohydrolase II
MSAAQSSSGSALFGTRESINVTRALGELQAGRPIQINAPGEALFILPVEGLDNRRLTEFVRLCRPEAPDLIITQQRALTLGLDAAAPTAVRLTGALDAGRILNLVAERGSHSAVEASAASFAAKAAIQLVKLSQGLPAVLAANLVGQDIIDQDPIDREIGYVPSIARVDADAVGLFAIDAVNSLVVASDALVPLASGITARFVVFRDAIGTDQVAIIVGKPDFAKPVPVRLHSACLTGDVFGSRRCDCGDQLALALTRMEELGGGVILYLAQEGRGLGLANKMRTYRLQDGGLDTLDANTTLGFDDDERDYAIAARMLHMLNCWRIQLLTNNPAKLSGLTQSGIEIAARVPLEAPVNPHNKRYLTTKAARSGHQLFNVTAFAADKS